MQWYMMALRRYADFSGRSRRMEYWMFVLGNFLINCAITELLSAIPASNTRAYAPLAAQAQKLLSPAEMGELFKVIALGKQLNTPLLGFARGDKSRTL